MARSIIGWGIVIYAVMYLVWSGLVMYGFAIGVTSLVVRVIALAVVTTIAARQLRIMMPHDILPYSLGWMLVAILLDGIFLVPAIGFSVFMNWTVWVGYALVALMPLLTAYALRRRSSLVSG